MSDNTLDLNGVEIKWLQENRDIDSRAKEIVGLYNLIVSAPQDLSARALFDAAVDAWRKSDGYLGKKLKSIEQ